MGQMTMNDRPICFVMMPITDFGDYGAGHFRRVYDHLITKACEKAGFKAIRADDVVNTNYIVIDILTKLIESDIAICDLSGRNPNVLYELGVRQAFNKPVTLIKDTKTDRVFDIQGLRCIDYDPSMRVDSVEKDVLRISEALVETAAKDGKDINSLIQLLSLKPAELMHGVEMSKESTLILSALEDISGRIQNLETIAELGSRRAIPPRDWPNIQFTEHGQLMIKGVFPEPGHTLVIGDEPLSIVRVFDDRLVVKRPTTGDVAEIPLEELVDLADVSIIPF